MQTSILKIRLYELGLIWLYFRIEIRVMGKVLDLI